MKLDFIPLDKLCVSKANMRYTRKAPDVSDILPTVRRRGVVQPVIVRPNGAPDAFEIIAGARRFQAALIVAEDKRAAGEADTETLSLPCAILEEGDDALVHAALGDCDLDWRVSGRVCACHRRPFLRPRQRRIKKNATPVGAGVGAIQSAHRARLTSCGSGDGGRDGGRRSTFAQAYHWRRAGQGGASASKSGQKKRPAEAGHLDGGSGKRVKGFEPSTFTLAT